MDEVGQTHSLKGKIQLVRFSVGKILQLQAFVLCEICLNLFPESTQIVYCRQNTPPLLLSLSAAILHAGLSEAPTACYGGMAPRGVLWISGSLICSVVWGPLPVPCHFLKPGECCQKKGKESRRVRGKSIGSKSHPEEEGESQQLTWIMRFFLLVKVLISVCMSHSLCTCSGSFWTRQLLACFSQTADAP